MEQLTRYGPIFDYKDEVRIGSVEHTMRRIKNKTGAKIARKIYNLNEQLHLEKYFS